MVSKRFIFSFICTFFAFVCWSQEEKKDATEIDSLKIDLEKEGLVVIDTLVTEKASLNPLAPAKAGFYSALIPGLGQIYNKRYWKVPIVWAAVGGGVYVYTIFDGQYNDLRAAFKRRRVGFPINDSRIPETITNDQLERLQNSTQSDRDLALLVTILIYALNVVDANVDAHLKQFNIDEDLSLDMQFQPYLEMNAITNNPNYGLALTINF